MHASLSHTGGFQRLVFASSWIGGEGGGDDVLCFKIQYDEVLRQEVVD